MYEKHLEKFMSLDGRVAVVVGSFGSQDNGRAVAQSLLERGALVVLASGGAAGDFSKMDGAERPFSANLQNHQEIRSLYSEIKERYGKLDILVICTDVYRGGSVTKATAEDWEISYQTNVYTLFQLVNNAIPYMYESGGVIVNVTGGRYVAALPGMAPYVSTTFAAVRMMKNFADEASKYKIRFNTVCAGNISGEAKPTQANYLGRTGTPEDVGAAVAFLASPAARFVNAATIMLDGGSCDSGLH